MRVKVHRNRLTLPEEARRKLDVEDSGELELEVTGDGVVLRSSASRRKAAYERIQAVQRRVEYVGPQPRPSAEREEREIAQLVGGDKRKR